MILTAFSQRDLVERARAAGAMAYLVKPFQRSELIPAVEVALGRFKEVKALEAEVRGLEEQLETNRQQLMRIRSHPYVRLGLKLQPFLIWCAFKWRAFTRTVRGAVGRGP